MNNNDEIEELSDREKLLMALARILDEHITAADKEYLEELITHSECGIAFEEIVATIVAQKINISEHDYEGFAVAGKSMNLNPSKWIKLKDLII